MSSRPLHKELVWGDKERAAKLAVSADQERAILTAFVAARAEERASIVAFVRSIDEDPLLMTLDELASAIERGDHTSPRKGA